MINRSRRTAEAHPPAPTEMSRAAVLRALAALREHMDAHPAVPVPSSQWSLLNKLLNEKAT